MCAHYKFILDKRRKRDDNVYPLKMRVYDNDGNKEKSLEIYLHESDWDDKKQVIMPSDPNYKNNNFRLSSARNKVERRTLIAVDEEEVVSPEIIIASVTKRRMPKSSVTVREFSNELIKNMVKAHKAGNSMAYKDAINSIIKYSGKEDLKFEEISYKLLDNYNTDMLAGTLKKDSKGIKKNSIAAYMRSIRAIYNKAIKAEIVDAKFYPFSKFTIQTEETISRALTLQEIKKIVNYDLKPFTAIWHNRNYFILSFCLIGINFADLLTLEPNNLQENRIVYKRNKTGRIYNIGLLQNVQDLIRYYQSVPSNNNNKYILPILPDSNDSLKERTNIKQVCKTCNKYLKKLAEKCEIDRNITTYYARYSWANIAKKELGLSHDLIADALGHQYGNKVTGIYLDNYSNETIDKANKAVIELILGK
jgi:integrase/recombinase XerD